MINFKKLIVVVLAIVLPVAADAYGIKIGELYYSLDDVNHTARVVNGSGYFEDGDRVVYYSGNIVIPEQVEYNGITYTVTSIEGGHEDGGFMPPNTCSFEDSSISSITIPKTIKAIEDYTFRNCASLRNVIFEGEISSIGTGAFRNCSSLTSFVIPEGVESIGWPTFENCSSLESITVPSSLRTFPLEAFSNCENLKAIYISSLESWCNIDFGFSGSPLTIAHNLYLNNELITDLVIPEGITTINDAIFSGGTCFTSVTIPNTVRSIGDQSFYGCNNVHSLTIGNNVECIGADCFRGCNSLTDVFCFGNKAPNVVNDDDVGWGGSFAKDDVKNATLHINGHAIKSYKHLVEEYIDITEDSCALVNYYTFSEPWCWFREIVIIPGTEALYTLSYMVDGNLYKSDDYNEGDAIIPEPEPTKEGYSFSGWSEIPETMPDHDVTVTGSFSTNKYKLIYMVDGEVYKQYDIKYGSTIIPEAEPKKDGYTFSGWSEIPDEMPAYDVTVTGVFTRDIIGQCEKPIISFDNNTLFFSCDTPDAEYHYTITAQDAQTGISDEIELSATYNISVYASAEGYADSEVNIATLCWVATENIATYVEDELEVKAKPVLIQNEGNTLYISGIAAGTNISIYNSAGMLITTTKAQTEYVSFDVPNTQDIFFIIKVGDQSIKYFMQ